MSIRHSLTLVALLLLLGRDVGANSATRVFMPLIITSPNPTYRINVPTFTAADLDQRFGELAIFWFGQVEQTSNYADVRIGANDHELYVYVAVFDRRLWYDPAPIRPTLAAWDTLTLYLDSGSGRLSFSAQLSPDGGSAYQAVDRYGVNGWEAATVPFTTRPGWRGEGLNDDRDDRGWAMTFRIPFTSMGLEQAPSDGTFWRMALLLNDRDEQAIMPIRPQLWPPDFNPNADRSWGFLHFGLPGYAPPDVSNPTTYTLRHGLDGMSVPDAGVGGGSTCGEGLDFWREWGNSTRDAGRADFNIQNQSDIADWPCFAKYYVTFPLDRLPRGQRVVAARLILHQFGGSQPEDATPSLIQVHVVGEDWDEATLSWNNAPPARENVAATWVPPLLTFPDWPGVPREFELSRAVAAAYAAETPLLRLALYSADSDYHSGKYFVSSDTGDWNAAGRPTLVVTLGD